MTDVLFGVWTSSALLSALLTGLGIGYVAIGAVIRNPHYSSGLATPRENLAVVALISMLGGGAFWLGQVLAAYADGDPLFWRIASRFTVWLIFCVGLSAGAYLAAQRDRARRAAAARAKALAEQGPGARGRA